jgi:hypothetical protein
VNSPWKAPSEPEPYLIIFGHAATSLYVGEFPPISKTKGTVGRQNKWPEYPHQFFLLHKRAAQYPTRLGGTVLLPVIFITESRENQLTTPVRSDVLILPPEVLDPAWNSHKRGYRRFSTVPAYC